MTTIKEIAQQLNLSSATVSRALRNDETLSISSETKSRIFMTAEQLGYEPKDKKKRSSKARQSITVIHKQQTFRNQIDSSYYFLIRAGIEDACAPQKYSCTFVTLESLNDFQVPTDAIVIVGNYSRDQFDRILSRFKTIPIATVGVISHYPDKIDHITFHNKDSVSIALQYLLEKGHRNIGYMGIEEAPGTNLFGSRKQCFTDILKKEGLFRPDWVRESSHGRDRVERGYMMTKEWILEQKEMPTAIFCANDPVALGAVKALHEEHIAIPDQISIITHDGAYPTQYTLPPLTTVDVHPYQLGHEAITILSERLLHQREIAKRIVLYPTLIERDSVKCLTP